MRYLTDECLCEQSTGAMEALSPPTDHFAYIAGHEVARAGAPDADIPGICQAGEWNVLITANVRDFGARKWLWRSLLDAGVHVLVVRPGKHALDEFLQVSIMSRHYVKYAAAFADAAGPSLGVLTESGFRLRDLDELIAEIEGGDVKPLP